MECRQEFQTSKISKQIKQSMSYRRNDLKSYTPSKTSEYDRTIQPNPNKDLMEILLVIYNTINKNLNIDMCDNLLTIVNSSLRFRRR